MYANKIWSIIVEHSFLMDLSNRWLHNEVAQYIMQSIQIEKYVFLTGLN